ncbi:hypothetical protein TrLO_g3712 [Triparma laevis f. longispina]|uniref:EamA domain-containing protein n=1 Tax=Triparma laevis f. longispina TaxID=1714387 RepID=A0A9W7KVD6_9STRA|nr:hypothetical protein TrLO_g3712 [Triparma laevis f. longispina]
MTVPIAWGTYTPIIKQLYTFEPPVPGLIFSTAYYAVAFALLSLASSGWSWWSARDPDRGSDKTAGVSLVVETTIQPNKEANGDLQRASLELSSYLFFGNILQLIGLRTTSATKSAFLVQLTTIIVPVLSSVLNKYPIKPSTIAACLTAFVGVTILSLDSSADATSISSILNSLNKGDILILISSISYSLHVVRLGTIAKDVDPTMLAINKSKYELFFGLIGCGVVCGFGGDLWIGNGDEFLAWGTHFWEEGMRNIEEVKTLAGSVLWTGGVTCGWTIWAQSFGQRQVKAENANLIYTAQPLASAAFAYLLLGERLKGGGVVGAVLIGVALGIVLVEERREGI